MESNSKKGFSEKILQKIKSMEMQDWLVVALIVVVFAVQFSIFSQFKQIPGPIYGGDAYHHKGMSQHIYNGNAPWTDPYYKEGYAFYPWLAHISVVAFAFLTGLSILKAWIFFPIIMSILAIIVTYLLGIKVFNSKTFALLFAALWMSFRIIPSSAPTDLALALMMPAAALYITYAKTFKQRIFAGIIYGLCGLTHAAFFIGVNIFLLLLIAYRIVNENIYKADGKIKIRKGFGASLKNQLKWVSLILLVGVPVAMLYWGPVIFVYHGQTLNPLQEYSGIGVQGLNAKFVYDTMIKPIVFDISLKNITTTSVVATIFSILAILGIYYLVKNPLKSKVVLLFYLTAFIGLIHPIIIVPLFNTSFGFYWFPAFASVSRILLIVFGIYLLYLLVKKYVIKNDENLKYYIAAAAIVLFALSANIYINSFKSGQFTQAGFSLPAEMKSMFKMGDWIMANTDNNDVFVSTHPETSFALQALTGRKVMFSRRTHSSHFMDVNKRAADEAVMLYGNDESKTKELLNQYGVKYLYHDYYSLYTKQQCEQLWNSLDDPNAQLQSYVCLQTTAEFESYLKEYGVPYKKVISPMDPAGGPDTPKFAMLAINPSQFNNYISNNSVLIHQEFVPGGMVAILYRIK